MFAGVLPSLSARRAWIEISIKKRTPAKPFSVALRKESVDRNCRLCTVQLQQQQSLSARRAWIEIAGSLDDILAGVVALRKESVDRNKYVVQCRKTLGVALRKESVDRNYKERPGQKARPKSLSARRAWIEICSVCSSKIICSCRSPQGERG